MPLSEERKQQLMGLAKRIKQDPTVMKALMGKEPPTEGMSLRKRLLNLPPTKSIVESAAKDITGERSVEGQQKQTRFLQEQQARGEGRRMFSFLSPAESERFEIVPTKIGEQGEIVREVREKPQILAERERREQREESRVKQQEKLSEGQRMAEGSLGVVTGTINDFSDLLADAYREGSIGDLVKATKTAFSQKIGGPGEPTAAAKIPGKKVEIITKMMPLLTQQGDKPGSVRLVSTVFERLSDTAPGASEREDIRGNQIGPVQARGMLEETIRSMFRFAQAIQSLGLTNEKMEQIPGDVIIDPRTGAPRPEKGSELSKVGELISRVADNVVLSEPDQAALDNLIAQTLKPLDELILEMQQQQRGAGGLSETQRSELEAINEELERLGAE